MGQLLQTLLRILLCLVPLHTSASLAQSLFDVDDHFTFNPQGKYQPRLIGLFETDRNNTSGAAEVITRSFRTVMACSSQMSAPATPLMLFIS